MRNSFPPDEGKGLSGMGELRVLDTPPEERFDRITRVATKLFRVPIALITLIDANGNFAKSCIGIPLQESAGVVGFCSKALFEENILYIPDALQDPKFADDPRVSGSPHIRFYAGYPLISHDGLKVGTLCILDQESRTMTVEELQWMQDLGAWARLELVSVQKLRKTIHERNQLLEEKEYTFFSLMEGLPIGVFVLDQSGRPYYANKTAQQLLGKGIMEETTVDELSDVYSVFIEGTERAYPSDRLPIVRALEGQSTEVDDIEIRTPDRSIILHAWATPIFDKRGQITHAVSAFQDITEEKRTRRRLVAHQAVTSILSRSPSLAEATPKVLQAISKTVGWPVGALWRVDRENNVLVCVDIIYSPDRDVSDFVGLSRKISFPPGMGLPGRVWSTGEPAWIPNIVEDSNFPRTPGAMKAGLHSAFGFPIRAGDEIIGVMEFFNSRIHQPDETLLSMFNSLGSQIGQFIEKKRTEETLQDIRRSSGQTDAYSG